MKKLFFLIISTFIFSFAIVGSTHATTFIDGAEYWSIDELLNLAFDYADELRYHCPRLNYEEEFEYYMCIDNYYWNKHTNQETGEWIEETKEEMALNHFKYEGSFLITSINPSRGIIRAVYHDLPWPLGGAVFDKKYDLDQFHFFWSEEEDFYKVYNTPNEFKNNVASPKDHIIFFGDALNNGENWFVANRELELPKINPIDTAKAQGYYFYADATSQGEIGSSISSMFDIDECVNSPNYSDGMECRLMYSAESGKTYLPFEADTKPYYKIPYRSLYVQENPTEQNIDEEGAEAELPSELTSEPTSNPEDPAPEVVGPELEELISELPTATTSNIEENQTTPAAPNTGVAIEPICEKTIEFPWWITLLVAMGEMLVLWWFFPIRKNPKNHEKKS